MNFKDKSVLVVERLTIDQRFWDKVNTDGDCWLWQGGKAGKGYGVFFLTKHGGPRMCYAHRWSYSRYVGEIPMGHFVCHRCDTPACVRPDHLFTGTAQDNVSDAVSKHRLRQGSNHQNSKLTEAEVRMIRARIGNGTLKQLAAEFGVCRATIQHIRDGVVWRHVE